MKRGRCVRREGFLFTAGYYSGICMKRSIENMKLLFYTKIEAVPTRQHGITSQNTASFH
jgi:hypothetical protein